MKALGQAITLLILRRVVVLTQLPTTDPEHGARLESTICIRGDVTNKVCLNDVLHGGDRFAELAMTHLKTMHLILLYTKSIRISLYAVLGLALSFSGLLFTRDLFKFVLISLLVSLGSYVLRAQFIAMLKLAVGFVFKRYEKKLTKAWLSGQDKSFSAPQ